MFVVGVRSAYKGFVGEPIVYVLGRHEHDLQVVLGEDEPRNHEFLLLVRVSWL